MASRTLNKKPKKAKETLQAQTINLSHTPLPQPPQELHTRVKHMCNLGDIIAILPAIKKYWQVTGRKVILSQQVNAPAHYYHGAIHPTTDENGTMVCVNNAMFEMVKPLIESQPYIAAMEKYEGQHIDLNFDVIRGQTDVGMPNGMIQSWIMYAFPDLDYDLSTTWIDLPEVENHPVEDQVKGKVIINFTERYRNPLIDYFFLRKYAHSLIFAGTDREHFIFCNKWNLNIPRLNVRDFLEYAYALKHSRFLLGNQTLGWNLGTALGTKRILEVCKYAPNCAPFIGENSKGFYYQVGVEHYFDRWHAETIPK